MKKVVVDTNILFSALLRFPNSYANAIFEEDIAFYTPHFVIVELFKHKERIIKRSNLSETDVLEILYRLIKNIRLISEEDISNAAWKSAYQLTHDIDIKDTPFVALTIALEAELWSSDKKLKNHLLKKGFDTFFDL